MSTRNPNPGPDGDTPAHATTPAPGGDTPAHAGNPRPAAGRPGAPFTVLSSERYRSRRSPVLGTGGAVASSQPAATRAGLQILDAGGSAADAAVAVAAALQVTQACSTGLGGDAFMLYYEAGAGAGAGAAGNGAGKIHALNGSGRSPGALTLAEALRVAPGGAAGQGGGEGSGRQEGSGISTPRAETPTLPLFHAHTVTVPGAAAAWEETHRAFGRLSFAEVLAPAIRLAREGFPVAPYTSWWWSRGAERQLSKTAHGHELMIDRRGPEPGEILRLPTLAATLEALARDGAEVFYRGSIAERIVAAVREAGGLMTLEDLAAHRSEWVEPIGVEFAGHRVWECPPNGQGIAALMALGIYDAALGAAGAGAADGGSGAGDAGRGGEGRAGAGESGAGDYHLMVEAMRLGFADARRYVADPAAVPVPTAGMIDPAYLASRAALIDPARARELAEAGTPPGGVGDDTVYFSVVDAEGNACSFINSNYMGFGTGIVPEGCGFSLQNRGHGFVLEEGHPNALAPGKRPYHTIIPGMITRQDGSLAAAFGVMGGMMQPQGHLQVADALLRRGIDPQAALDRERFQLADGDPNGRVLLEEASPVEGELRDRGHQLQLVSGRQRAAFGLGQVIWREPEGVLWCGSDPRGDGLAQTQ